MRCEKDRAVMHAVHESHAWSTPGSPGSSTSTGGRLAKRYATSGTAVGYPERGRPVELTEAQLAHLRRWLGVCAELRATTLYREILELGYVGSYASFAVRGHDKVSSRGHA